MDMLGTFRLLSEGRMGQKGPLVVFLSEILVCVTILHTKIHYHIGLYFQLGVSQLEKYGPYMNWTVAYLNKKSLNGQGKSMVTVLQKYRLGLFYLRS